MARDDDRLPDTVAGRHVIAFAGLMLHHLVTVVANSPYQALGAGDLGAILFAATLLRPCRREQ